jgi:hypothetical protein
MAFEKIETLLKSKNCFIKSLFFDERYSRPVITRNKLASTDGV